MDHELESYSDGRLLAEFAERQDRAAFAELVRRHHGVVQGVCRTLLGNTADADDAYQATFLVLVRNSKKVRKADALASWLYGVAYRIGLRMRRRRARSQAVELQDTNMPAAPPLKSLVEHDQRTEALEAIHRLPEKLRLPFVLRYLHERSNREVADQLAISEAAVEGRLKRAKTKLRTQLIRNGLTLSLALAAVNSVANDCPADDDLIEQTLDMCCSSLESGTPSSVDSTKDITYKAMELSQEELSMLATLKLTKLALAGCIALTATGLYYAPSISSAYAGDGVATAQSIQTSAVNSTDGSLAATTQFQAANPAADDPFAAAPDDASDNPFDDAGQDAAAEDPFDLEPENTEEPFSIDDSEPAATASVTASLANAQRPANPEPNPSTESQPFSPYSTHKLTHLEHAIVTALDKPTNGEFYDESLETAVSYLSDLMDSNIRIDRVALDELGLSVDESVTLKMKNARLRSVLNHLTRDLDLTYTLRDETLLITSHERASENMSPRIYKLGRMRVVPSPDNICEMITHSIEPQSWTEVGGAASISVVDLGSIESSSKPNYALVIRQTPEAHHKINELLKQLDELN